MPAKRPQPARRRIIAVQILLLCAIAISLRGKTSALELLHQHSSGQQLRVDRYALTSERRSIFLNRFTMRIDPPGSPPWPTQFRYVESDVPIFVPTDTISRSWGFGCAIAPYNAGWQFWIPWWSVHVGLIGILLYLNSRRIARTLRMQFAIARRLERLDARASHVCLTCGYDVRATPTRCPECGNPPYAPLKKGTFLAR